MEMLDELILKLSEKRYDIDDLYYKVMGRHPVDIGGGINNDQNNSVFYS